MAFKVQASTTALITVSTAGYDPTTVSSASPGVISITGTGNEVVTLTFDTQNDVNRFINALFQGELSEAGGPAVYGFTVKASVITLITAQNYVVQAGVVTIEGTAGESFVLTFNSQNDVNDMIHRLYESELGEKAQ